VIQKIRSKIFAKVLLFVCAAVFTILFSSFYVFEQIEYEEKKTALLKRQKLITQSQAIIIAQYIQNNDEEPISLTLSGVLSNPSIVGVAIHDLEGKPLYSFGEFESADYRLFEQSNDITTFSGSAVRTLGVLLTVATERYIVEDMQQRRKFYAFVFAVLFVVIIVAVYASIHLIVAIPLNRLINAILQESQFRAQSQLREELRHREKMFTDLLVMKDAAEQASRAKSEFLAAMSHELRTPLNAIIGFSEVIKEQIFGPVGIGKYLDYSKDIHRSGQHLLGLINDILDLAKIESGTHELHEEDIEFEEVIRAAMRLVDQDARKGGLAMQRVIPETLPTIRADRRQLKQILVNLLSNAVKFTDAGGQVTLKAWCRMDIGYVLQVVDTGIGIAPEDIPKALSRFGQIDAGLNRRYEGTGLGLPLTKALVEQHGGSLDIQSEIGVGTTVTVRFPSIRIAAPWRNADSREIDDRAAS
jgi:signal transduction histidine kinase